MKGFIKKVLAAAAAVSVSAGMLSAGYAVSASSATAITIFHTNDMHGHLMDAYTSSKVLSTIGSDYTAAIKNSVPDSLLIDAGDATQGLPFANINKGKDVISLMNAAGYDGMVLGNHEFDYGLDQTLSNAKLAKFPVVSANTVYNGKPLLDEINGGNGCDFTRVVKGVTIGFFGLTTQETSYKTNPNNVKGVTFENPVTVAKQEVSKLKGEGAQAIIAITHIGNDPSSDPVSTDIAKQVSGINVIIDGHSHTVENTVVNGTLITQTGCYNSDLGRIDLTVGSDGTVSAAENMISPAQAQASYTPDSNVKALADQINQVQSGLFSQVIGNTDTALWGGTVNRLSIGRIGETSMGDLVADAMADSAKSQVSGTENAGLPIVALENGGGVRDSLTPGNITAGQIETILPFGNILSLKAVTPAVLYDVIENGVSGISGIDPNTGVLSGANGRYPQVSGMRFEYDPSKTAAVTDPSKTQVKGNRVTKIVLLNPDGTDKKVLDRADTTTKIVLATNDYEDAGGDGYTMLGSLKNIGEGNALDVILENYIANLTKQGSGSFSYPISLNRSKAVGYQYTPYSAAVTLTYLTKPLANTDVFYCIDRNIFGTAKTDGSGVLNLTGVPSGQHTITTFANGNTAATYISDILGTTSVTSEMGPESADQKAALPLMQGIEDLPKTITLADKPQVDSLAQNYKALTRVQQNLVWNSGALKVAEDAITALTPASPVPVPTPEKGSSDGSGAALSSVNTEPETENPHTGDTGTAGKAIVLCSAAALAIMTLRKKK